MTDLAAMRASKRFTSAHAEKMPETSVAGNDILIAMRFTSAHAEKMRIRSHLCRVAESVHLRTRGENASVFLITRPNTAGTVHLRTRGENEKRKIHSATGFGQFGSPPHTRRKLRNTYKSLRCQGAPAVHLRTRGEKYAPWFYIPNRSVHLRTRGENLTRLARRFIGIGSPPHTRRKFNGVSPEPVEFFAVHLRTRGEN